MRRKTRTTNVRFSLFWVGLVIWISAPVAGIVMMATHSESVELVPERVVEVPVEVNDSPTVVSAQLSLTWSGPQEIFSTGLSGVVERVFLGPGDIIGDSSEVLKVAGITVRSYATPEPFYRALSNGSVGPDVAQLNTLLSRLGYGDLESDRWTFQTTQMVRNFASNIGVPAEYRSTFDPSWIVYVPDSQLVVNELAIQTGGNAPPAGEPLLSIRSQLVAAELHEATSDGLVGPPLIASQEDALFAGSIELGLSDTKDKVASDYLAVLQTSLEEDAPSVGVTLRRGPTEGEWRLPSGSIFVSGNDETCALVVRSGAVEAIKVTVISSSIGSAVVTAELRQSDRVQIAPKAEDRRCN